MNEPVSEQDMDRLAEDVLSLWKTQYEFWQRTCAQGAPPALQSKMARISENFKELRDSILELSPYFPREEE